jgi:hypothetical protein
MRWLNLPRRPLTTYGANGRYGTNFVAISCVTAGLSLVSLLFFLRVFVVKLLPISDPAIRISCNITMIVARALPKES